MVGYMIQVFQEYIQLVKTNTFLQVLTACGVAYVVFFIIFLIFYKRLENIVYNLNMNKWVVLLSFNIGTLLVSLSVYGFTKVTKIQMRQYFPVIMLLSMLEIAINFLSVAKFRDEEGYNNTRFRDSNVGTAVCLNILILLSTI